MSNLDNIRTITINEIELEYDIFELEFAEKYEKGIELIQKEAQISDSKKNISDVIKKQCEAVFNFFDDLFGDGTSEDVFGKKTNLMTCLIAFKTLTEAIESQVQETKPFIDELKNKNNNKLNRAQRRAKNR